MNESQDEYLWEEICFDLHNSSGTMSEELYEQRIIMSLGKMGWKQFKGEIILRQSIPIGSAQSIIPDIIVKSTTEDVSFVIEVKKPSISLTENNRSQLFSYMRQLKLEFGILFGEKIEIFYDGELSSSSSPVQIKTIEFNNSNKNFDFVKVFKKTSLSIQKLQDYARERINIVNGEKEKNDLRATIESLQFLSLLKEKAKHVLLDNYNEEAIDEIMKEFIISIESKVQEPKSTTKTFHQALSNSNIANQPLGKVEYEFNPTDEKEFKKKLLQKKLAYIKIIYKDGHEEHKTWNANKFTENSNLRGNINSKTWFRQDYIQRNGVIKAIFSIDPF